MKASEQFIEAWRDRGPIHLIAVILCTVTQLSLGLLTPGQAERAVSDEIQFRNAGSLVVLARAIKDLLPAAACDGLRRTDGVAAAGGMQPVTTMARVFPTGRDIPRSYVTIDAVRVWYPAAMPGVVYVGEDLAVTGQVQVGTVLASEGGRLIVGGEATSIPSTDISSRVLVPILPGGDLEQCWVRARPGTIEEVRAVVRARFAAQNPEVVENLAGEIGSTPADRWYRYSDTLPWAYAGFGSALVLGLVTHSRRPVWSVYRTFGMPPHRLLALLMLQSTAIVLAAGTVAATVLIVWAATSASPADARACTVALTHLGAATLASLSATLPIQALTLRATVAESLKDR